jgi:hypothetical protein
MFGTLGERGALRTTPKQRGGVTGKGFLPGHSGNAGGRPKGSKTYAIRQLVAEALNDPNVWKEAVERYRETLKTRKTVINGLEFAARVNREIGIGSNDEVPGGVTIIFKSNLRPGALRGRHEAGRQAEEERRRHSALSLARGEAASTSNARPERRGAVPQSSRGGGEAGGRDGRLHPTGQGGARSSRDR